MIRFSNVSKNFDNDPVLTDISFTVNKGELVYITGPSGAGKTTLLKLIYMSERPDEGVINVAKWDITKIKQRKIPYLRRDIGIVFQDFRLLFNRTVFENIALVLKIRGYRSAVIKELVTEALSGIGLYHKANIYPGHLSGGEQQRVAIARAMVSSPLILLADEPTGNLDPDSSGNIASLFKEINARGTTVLIATHSDTLYKGTGRRVIHLKDRHIEEETLG
jgi:cell division transport system ATP-binding protein